MTKESHFEELVGGLDYPMWIVTAAARGELAGCLVGFATQTSIEPSRFLVCLSRRNRTCRVASMADLLVVHLVPEHAQELAELFGGRTGDEIDKFSRCAWRPGPGGSPVLGECPRWFAGLARERLDLGDHVGFMLEPVDGRTSDDRSALTFHGARWIDAGKEA